MHGFTLPAFNSDQKSRAHALLATRVSEMMGRKFEEGDWSTVYTKAKGMPESSWSNLSIDITYGALGVEHKMMCRPSNKPLRDACGTSIMHPAGTRAIRIPQEDDATTAAREVLRQYGEIIDERTAIVRILNLYNHGCLDRAEASKLLAKEARMSTAAARAILPAKLIPVGNADDQPDMRFGWLLWEAELREFLYFEEPMRKPNPSEYTAEWRDTGGGRRRTSRSLWVYRLETGEKEYSITTDAGAKIQPYFNVPVPDDPNLYYFVAQGELVSDDLVRVWLTKATAELLKQIVGDLTPEAIGRAVAECDLKGVDVINRLTDSQLAVEVYVDVNTYKRLVEGFAGVSDEHNFKLLVDLLTAT